MEYYVWNNLGKVKPICYKNTIIHILIVTNVTNSPKMS